MPAASSRVVHNGQSNSLADILERVLDKGIVIAGDIKIKLVDVELLTIQVRLLVTSVDKAREMGIDFWTTDPSLSSRAASAHRDGELETLRRRVAELETALPASAKQA